MKIICASTSAVEQATWCELLAAALPHADVFPWQDDGPACDADVAVVWRPPADLFKRERELRVVFNLGAGVDALLKLPSLPDDVVIVRLEDAGMAAQMAEYVAHYVVRASRQFEQYEVLQKAGRWQPLPEIDRRQWPIGIMGLGVLGTSVARAMVGLDYPVAGWSRSGRRLEGVRTFAGRDALPAFLARTRVLVNLLPLTQDTEGILCRETLSQLLPDSHLINLGRGTHLVEEDLVPLLDSGRMAGAMLDVFRVEPLPDGHPFWTHPRIRITPHVAAITLRRETIEQIGTKILAFMRGETITGVVTRERGY
ncbi:glyoxylate/hydroxypyruvate reductase A [Bordetella sp. FB-8]|uniref:2-hydroxyacid dehydrogenase n=1 Tax=Bordetella sp. FB-8 TaxID=1159870 RepID=UPI00035EABD5|nr:glyoxylate/hydroxypyruvate reductase A [Bordetella sp. FB-8]